MALITTDRLLLRPLAEEDAPDVYAYSAGSHVGPPAGWKPHESEQESLEILKTVFLSRDAVFGIVLRETGHVIGSIGLIDDPKRENPAARMLGYALGKDNWGRGIMTEAVRATLAYGFERLSLALISAYCYPETRRSQRVLDKCGFVREGTLQLCERRYDGVVLDNLCYVLLREKHTSVE